MRKLVCSLLLQLTFLLIVTHAETTLLDVDFSKGNAGSGVVNGGKFTDQGWETTGLSDAIYWNFPNASNVPAGYAEVVNTNFDPAKQGEGKKNNQWFGFNSVCSGAGLKVRIVTGKNYKDWFKVEYTTGGEWSEPTMIVLNGPPDPKAIYRWRASWDKSGFKLSVNGKVFFTTNAVVKGICKLTIGETHYPVRETNIGVIYKSVKVVALDGSVPTPTPQEASAALVQGWNLISIPFTPSNQNIAEYFKTINGKFTVVYSFKNGSYKRYVPNSTTNDFTAIEAGVGYWVHMTEAAQLIVTGTASSRQTELTTGWNLVGLKANNSIPIEQALASISTKVKAVYSFQNGGYVGYAPPDVKNLSTLEPTRGYWVFAAENAQWTY
jgi:hypothetical protein